MGLWGVKKLTSQIARVIYKIRQAGSKPHAGRGMAGAAMVAESAAGAWNLAQETRHRRGALLAFQRGIGR